MPWRLTRRDAFANIYDDQVVIHIDGAIVAQHPRAVGKYQDVIDPLHLIDLIAHKHRAALTALAFADGRVPRPLLVLRDRLLERDGPMATKAWTTILLLAKESSFEREATDLLFQVISQRYERASIAITTNLAFEQWTQVFPDAMAASAVIDRIIHHGTIFEFSGASHRLRSRGTLAK